MILGFLYKAKFNYIAGNFINFIIRDSKIIPMFEEIKGK